MISVIIPTCDRPMEYLGEAVLSALSQSRKPGEVIVVDNGTNPVDADSLPKGTVLYRLPARVGPSRARNFGAAMARGDHVAFLDDDDYWDGDFLKETWSVMQSEGVDCVYGRKDSLSDGVIREHKARPREEFSIDVMLRRNPGVGGTNLLVGKTAFWRAGGFDERMRMTEDRALAIEILRSGGTVSVAPKAAVIVRDHGGERLGHSDLRRFAFVWKYRRLMGIGEVVKRSAWILSKAARRQLRSR